MLRHLLLEFEAIAAAGFLARPEWSPLVGSSLGPTLSLPVCGWELRAIGECATSVRVGG